MSLKEQMNVYAISGLGADQRVFSELELDEPLHHIHWISPKSIDEPIASYALRLCDQIEVNQPFILVGVSFGGLIATEINKIYPAKQLILISSTDTQVGIKPLFRLFKHFVPLLPQRLLVPPLFLIYYVFGTKRKALLRSIVKASDLFFNKWAICQLVAWDSLENPTNCVKINGDADKLIAPQQDERTIIVQGGGHFMIMDQSEEVSELVNNLLSKMF